MIQQHPSIAGLGDRWSLAVMNTTAADVSDWVSRQSPLSGSSSFEVTGAEGVAVAGIGIKN